MRDNYGLLLLAGESICASRPGTQYVARMQAAGRNPGYHGTQQEHTMQSDSLIHGKDASLASLTSTTQLA